jgi:hypothetical protein
MEEDICTYEEELGRKLMEVYQNVWAGHAVA